MKLGSLVVEKCENQNPTLTSLFYEIHMISQSVRRHVTTHNFNVSFNFRNSMVVGCHSHHNHSYFPWNLMFLYTQAKVKKKK